MHFPRQARLTRPTSGVLRLVSTQQAEACATRNALLGIADSSRNLPLADVSAVTVGRARVVQEIVARGPSESPCAGGVACCGAGGTDPVYARLQTERGETINQIKKIKNLNSGGCQLALVGVDDNV